MKTRTFFKLALGFLAAFTAIAAVLGAGPDFFLDFGMSLRLRWAIEAIAWLLIAIFGLLYAAAAMSFVGDKVDSLKVRRGKFSRRSCGAADIDRIAAIAQDEFGAAATNLAETRAIHHLDPTAFMVLVDGKGEIAEYRCVLCLSPTGVKLVRSGKFSVRTLTKDHLLAGSRKVYRNVYVGAVWGRNPHCRGLIRGSVDELLTEKKPTAVFARAATGDGLHLLQAQGFSPIGGVPALNAFFVRE